jgi:hypothetical protein
MCLTSLDIQRSFKETSQILPRKEQAATMGGLIDMLGHNPRPPPRPTGGRGSGSLVDKTGAAGGGGTGAGRGKGSPGAGKGAP